MLDYKRICAPTDFSEMGDRAVDAAADLARRFGAELHILHVIQDVADKLRHPDFTAHGTSVNEFLGKLESGATEYLAKLSADKPWRDLKVNRVHLMGAPVEQILRYAEQNGIDLIVVGSHGRTNLKSLLLGSTAERLIRQAPCAVLTLRPPTQKVESVEPVLAPVGL